MSNTEKWEEFLKTANGAEMFKKVTPLLMDGKITKLQAKILWDRWRHHRDEKTKNIFEKALDPNWWATTE